MPQPVAIAARLLMCPWWADVPTMKGYFIIAASDYKSFMAVDLLVFAGGLGGHVCGGAAAGFIAVEGLPVAVYGLLLGVRFADDLRI